MLCAGAFLGIVPDTAYVKISANFVYKISLTIKHVFFKYCSEKEGSPYFWILKNNCEDDNEF
jgi:hypothetical protein